MVGYNPNRNQLSNWELSSAAATSGAVTRVIAQPLDVLKIRFQLQVEPIQSTSTSKYTGITQAILRILREEGASTFWKGHVPAQWLSITFGVSQFLSFELFTKSAWNYLPAHMSNELRPITHFVCGGMAGFVATVSSLPFDVIRTRFVAQGNQKIYRSFISAPGIIVRTEGLKALFKGFLPTVLQIAPQTGLQFGFYSTFTSLWKNMYQSNSDTTNAIGSLICGSASGLCSKAIVFPLDLTKKRLQVQGFEHGRSGFGVNQTYTGFANCFVTVYRQEGFFALYKGLSPSLLKAVITTASHFFIYEQCCNFLLERHEPNTS